jgi:hypothetical protein
MAKTSKSGCFYSKLNSLCCSIKAKIRYWSLKFTYFVSLVLEVINERF